MWIGNKSSKRFWALNTNKAGGEQHEECSTEQGVKEKGLRRTCPPTGATGAYWANERANEDQEWPMSSDWENLKFEGQGQSHSTKSQMLALMWPSWSQFLLLHMVSRVILEHRTMNIPWALPSMIQKKKIAKKYGGQNTPRQNPQIYPSETPHGISNWRQSLAETNKVPLSRTFIRAGRIAWR